MPATSRAKISRKLHSVRRSVGSGELMAVAGSLSAVGVGYTPRPEEFRLPNPIRSGDTL